MCACSCRVGGGGEGGVARLVATADMEHYSLHQFCVGQHNFYLAWENIMPESQPQINLILTTDKLTNWHRIYWVSITTATWYLTEAEAGWHVLVYCHKVHGKVSVNFDQIPIDKMHLHFHFSLHSMSAALPVAITTLDLKSIFYCYFIWYF